MTIAAPAEQPKKPFSIGRVIAWILLGLMVVISVFPVLIVLKTALTSNKDIFTESARLWPTHPTLINFERVLGLVSPEVAQAAGGSGSTISFASATLNSVIFTVLIVVGQTF